ncbi:FAD/NAD(P)-binding protein [Sphingobacterium griseoflavum]|uniref:FAD-dependent urate hydroxylase HpyO/Asp monooxygenase CreE-like FAD/NAD(P)-binding domain-containing protein n=1 Tax=Sphingobacterium griseoflavum TaxID=1474952 RepID=A0ABQ3I345_9SPHI|nr:FAD/NAD(P)-binding protein [Sphingobacterium griseoflavum]GHE45624.1 hypothetical protein GCM10017764_31100 [Sphingobacterium griseoflavum]
MIWKKEHISNQAEQASQQVDERVHSPVSSIQDPSFNKGARVGIIGGGPKGFYALERLFAQLEGLSAESSIDVFWFNEDSNFGCGPNYRVHQPDYLLINYCIGNIDAWNRDEKNLRVSEQLNLTDWIRANKVAGPAVQPTDYASRALVGCYLQDQLLTLLRAKPHGLTLHFVLGRVTDIRHEEHFNVHVDQQSDSLPIDHLLLATGHCYRNQSLLTSAEAPSDISRYFRSAYPVQKLDTIPAGESVGIIGLGLTFIDAALQLTEGRGGQFTEDGQYVPSGTEPRIFAYSRNNLPILPRGPIYGGNHYRLRTSTIACLKRLAIIKRKRKIDFKTEIYPILQDEAQFAYYSTLLQTADELRIARYCNALPKGQLFQLEDLLFPKYEKTAGEVNSVLHFLENSLAEAERGELHSPLLAATAVWRESTPWIGHIYAHHGFTGVSQQTLDRDLWGAFCRTSFGPPIANMRKIVALARAGIIQFTTARLTGIEYEPAPAQFVLINEQTKQNLTYLVDARIARGNLLHANSALYARLLATGLITPASNDGYHTGGPALQESGQAAIGLNSSVPSLFFYGTSTEGMLLDNDSLSRKRNDTGSSWAKHVREALSHQTKNKLYESYSRG